VSHATVEIVRSAYEALRTGGIDAILEYIDPDFEATAPPELSVEPQTYYGREGVRRWYESFFDAVDEVRLEGDEFIDRGAYVVVPGRIVVRGHDSGIEVAQEIVQVWEIRDSKAVGMRPFADKESALRALDSESQR
jgi:ketosteroid isomerase-like protein